MMHELVLKNRSYRRFNQEYPVDRNTLYELIELARLTGSGKNAQALKYLVSADPELNARVFHTLKWAAYLKDWGGPVEGERPSAYVVVLDDTAIEENPVCDRGIAMQTILLGAVERGLGGCILGAINRGELATLLALPKHLRIGNVIALGQPKESIVIEGLREDGDVRYWRGADGVHHVPKRPLSEIIVGYKAL